MVEIEKKHGGCQVGMRTASGVNPSGRSQASALHLFLAQMEPQASTLPQPIVVPSPRATSVAGAVPPPARGIPLGFILGLTISVLVMILLGGLTSIQMDRDEKRERAAREGLLAESVAPLVEQVKEAKSVGEIQRCCSALRLAEIALGRTDYNVVVRSAAGEVVGFGGADIREGLPEDSLRTSVNVRSKAFPHEVLTLTAWQNASVFSTEMAQRRREAWTDIGITVLAIIFAIQLAIYLVVSRPLSRMLIAIDKFEQGYPADFRGGSAASELSWLMWRLQQMSVALTNSARLLVAAHRKAAETSKARNPEVLDPMEFDPLSIDERTQAAGDEIVRRYLRDRCAFLEGLGPSDPGARDIAVEVWELDAVEAERLGEMNLHARLEDTALSILDPGDSQRVTQLLESLISGRASWSVATADRIKAGLAADGLRRVAIQHRVKHAAGVWRKMQEKNLTIEEVHDLFAFRIIVPEHDDCYLALETVHRLFEPEPFRFKDYISSPKTNGYQSLHSSVRDPAGFVFELQIRSIDMHRAAEGGKAAHWQYHQRQSWSHAERVTWRSG